MSDVLWTPPADVRQTTQVGRFLDHVRDTRGRDLSGYDELFEWSVSDLEGFWGSLWEFFGVRASTPYERVLGSREMPGAEWFTGARLNYAEHMLGRDEDLGSVAVTAISQTREPFDLTFADLREQVAAARAGLQRLGVGEGDRVVAYLPNIPETLIAFLAAASLGAVWATCATEFGPRAVIDRFAMLEPKVLLAIAGYRYGEKEVDRRAEVAEIRAALPAVEHVVHVPYAGGEDDSLPDSVEWPSLVAESGPLEFAQVSFDHPLYVLFSSGTTGLPKAIVHRHGGILVEHFKNHGLSWDIQRGDRLMWFTTTAWMMWNALVSTLLLRASIVMLDGNPLYPDMSAQWRLAEETRPTIMGAGPALLMGCRKAGMEVGRDFDLSSLRQLCAAGSPLPAEGFDWVYEQLGSDVLLNVGSGGTDVCCGVVQGGPLQPVYRGRDLGSLPGGGLGGVRPLGEGGCRRARRAGDPPADALDAGALLGGRRRRALPLHVLRRVPRHLALRRLDRLYRARKLRGDRPLRRDAEPRWRAAGDGRVLCSGGEPGLGAGLAGGAPGGPGGRPGRADPVRAAGRRLFVGRRAAVVNRVAHSAEPYHPATCRTRSSPCRRSPGR